VLYLDSSAIVKLVVREPETGALVRFVREDPAVVSSALAWTEVMRAIARIGGDTARAEAVLRGVALIPIDDGIIRAAVAVQPSTLRTLDAIHMATALSLGRELSQLVTYDERLARAGNEAGVAAVAPGA
jgi:predicted nucleic acid-binding protein